MIDNYVCVVYKENSICSYACIVKKSDKRRKPLETHVAICWRLISNLK